MLAWARFLFTIVVAGGALLVLAPAQLIVTAISGRGTSAFTVLWHRIVLWLIGVRVTVSGAISSDRPLLLLSNHMSWLDIVVLGSLAPLSFIAKSEVAKWPVFGLLAKAQRSIFIDRQRRHATGAMADQVADRMARGDIIVLFAEGTSSDGNHVLPFRSALIGAAHRAMGANGAATVQPVAIAYVAMLGIPLGRQHRARVAWYGGADLMPHLWHVVSRGGIDVQVVFGAARRLAPDTDRKVVAAETGAVVRRLVAGLNRGSDPRELLEPDTAA